jgi:hypothetical protein
MDLKKYYGWYGLESSGSGQRQVEGFCERGIEPSFKKHVK